MNSDYEPVSNMQLKATLWFTYIPTSVGGRGGRQGRGAIRGEDEKDAMLLSQRKAFLLHAKKKVEDAADKGSKEAKKPKTALAKILSSPG